MIKVTLKKDRLYEKLFKNLDRIQNNGSFGTLGGCRIQTEEEYETREGYVLEFKRLHPEMIDWIKEQKNMTIEL